MPPVFLSLGEILEIHLDQIERYGGDPAIRDLSLLQSALAMPSAGLGERFVDGNKRTGAVAALVFLSLNGVELEAGEVVFEKLVRAVAEGKADKTVVAEFFRAHAGK